MELKELNVTKLYVCADYVQTRTDWKEGVKKILRKLVVIEKLLFALPHR